MFDFLKKKKKKKTKKPLSIVTNYQRPIPAALASHRLLVETTLSHATLVANGTYVGFDKNILINGYVRVYPSTSMSTSLKQVLQQEAERKGKKLCSLSLVEATQGYKVVKNKTVSYLVNPSCLKLNNWIEINDLAACETK